MTGSKNPFFGTGLSKMALDKAAEMAGTKVYAYDVATFTLVNGVPFRSMRDAANSLPVGDSTLPRKMDTDVPFKGYYYYSGPRSSAPS